MMADMMADMFDQKLYETVDEKNPANLLRLVVELPLFTGFQKHPRWLALEFLPSTVHKLLLRLF